MELHIDCLGSDDQNDGKNFGDRVVDFLASLASRPAQTPRRLDPLQQYYRQPL